MRTALGRTWHAATGLAGTRRGAIVLLAAGLAVYGIQSLGWPTAPGRDLSSYLAVYVDLWNAHPVYPWAALMRTPVSPLVLGGVLDTGSGLVVALTAALMFAGSIVLYARTALFFSRSAAVLVGLALLLYPGYGVLFHGFSGDSVFATAFALWTFVVVRATLSPSWPLFALAGAATALLALTRPVNQVYLVVALVPLCVPGTWRARIGRALAFTGVAASLLLAWSAVNLWRADDFTLARGGRASFPLFRAFTVDRIVEPDNGPASRELAAVVARDLLTQEPYRSYGVDLHRFFAEGSPRMHEDLVSLSDEVWGWDSDYKILGRVGWEAVKAHPGVYTRAVLGDFWEELSQPLFAGRKAPSAAAATSPAPPDTVGSGSLPVPTQGEPIPSEHQSAQLSTPDGSIREVWTSATDHHAVFADPAKAERAAALDRKMGELFAAFPDHWWSPWLGLQMDRSSKLFPPLWLWLAVGVVAVVLRRPRRWWVLVAPVLASLAMLLATVAAVYAHPAYAVPVAPVFVLFAACGLVGERRHATAGAVSATSTPTSSALRTSR